MIIVNISTIYMPNHNRPAFYQICCLLWLLSGCSTPIGITQITAEESYKISTISALSGAGQASNNTKAVLQRFNLTELYERNPQQALLNLHQIALTDERRDLLFALAEISYAYGESLPENSSNQTERMGSKNVFLQSAIYAYLYLLGESDEASPSPYDRRFREACELYNRALGYAFRQEQGNGLSFSGGNRDLQVGTVNISLVTNTLGWHLDDFQAFYSADTFDVHGFTVRNRKPGLGLSVIGVSNETSSSPNGGNIPITAFLRVNSSLRDLQAGHSSAQLELYSAYDDIDVMVNGQHIPLQSDTTAPLAYRLNDAELWKAGLKNFMFGAQIENHMLLDQPYQQGRIPVVLVHGTGSSPVWRAEMVNTLRSDQDIRNHYQFWFYIYASSAPIIVSARMLRDTLTDIVKQFDPENKDEAIDQMVLIGHSQGGLLTKLAAVDPGDKLWRAITEKSFESFESLDIDPQIRSTIQHNLFFNHLPFVKRVIYISTPHRGSFLTKNWVRNLTRTLVTLPSDLIKGGAEQFSRLSGQLKLSAFLRDKIPTSVDGMSPNNPVMKALVEMPLAPGITGNSIIAVLPGKDIKTGNDGVVEYSSAHIDGAESEYIVRTGHSAQGHPLAIEEVRRILLKHINKK